MGDLREYRRDHLYVHRVVSPDGEGGLHPVHISLWDGYPDDGGRLIGVLYSALAGETVEDNEWLREHAINIATMLDEYPMPGWETVPEAKTAEGLAERIQELHRYKDAVDRDGGGSRFCVECRRDWPCPTTKLLDGL